MLKHPACARLSVLQDSCHAYRQNAVKPVLSIRQHAALGCWCFLFPSFPLPSSGLIFISFICIVILVLVCLLLIIYFLLKSVSGFITLFHAATKSLQIFRLHRCWRKLRQWPWVRSWSFKRWGRRVCCPLEKRSGFAIAAFKLFFMIRKVSSLCSYQRRFTKIVAKKVCTRPF